MLTFFEGFIYAIAPDHCFYYRDGQHRPPVSREICTNHPLDSAMDASPLNYKPVCFIPPRPNEMSSLSAGGLNSMYALSSTGDVLQHWIATGGMLAARRTPVISCLSSRVAPTPSPAWHRE